MIKFTNRDWFNIKQCIKLCYYKRESFGSSSVSSLLLSPLSDHHRNHYHRQLRNCHQSIAVNNRLDKQSSNSIFDQKIIVEGENVPDSWKSVFDYEWPGPVKDYLTQKNIIKPTGIQSQAWPIALGRRDLVGIAQTGSGKTLAYILPALVFIDKTVARQKSYIGPKAVVLAPTRELAQQINQVAVEIGYHIPVCLHGGAARRVQKESLTSRQPEIVIATPGRLNDLIDEKNVDLSSVGYLVLDEADRMLDLGFEGQIRRIVDRTPKPPHHRQTLLFSATWPKEVHDLSLDLLNNFIQVNVGSTRLTANPNITQRVLFPDPVPRAKEKMLIDLLKILDDGSKKLPSQKILIFVARKKDADYLQRHLNAQGFFSMSIHSDRAQHSRNLIIEAFRSGSRSILIGTDIASRGLDIEDITVVINYDMPNTLEDYVHRIGRTARSEKTGTSYSFFTPDDARLAKSLIQLLKDSGQTIDDKLIQYGRLISPGQEKRDRMGYPKYGAPVKRQSLDNIMSNYRKVHYNR